MSHGEQIRQELGALLRQRILLLDGAMGTMIQSHKLDEAGYRGKEFAGHSRDLRLNNDALNLSQPQIIGEIQRQYLDAGADIIETNTFNSNAISMAEYALEHRDHVVCLGLGIPARDLGCDVGDDHEDAPDFVPLEDGPVGEGERGRASRS